MEKDEMSTQLKYKITDLFKSPLYKTKLELSSSKVNELIADVYKVQRDFTFPSREKHTFVGGWQSDDLRHFDKTFVEIVLKHVNLFAKKLELKTPLILANMWISINKYNDYTLTHMHRGSVISGVFYLQSPKDGGDIVFTHPLEFDHQRAFFFFYDMQKDKVLNSNAYNSYTWTMPTDALTLYLFPNWMLHGVKPSQNKRKDRIALSFNFHYKTLISPTEMGQNSYHENTVKIRR